MSDFETLVKQARDLGYEELREYVAKEQTILRDERKEKRDEEKRDNEKELRENDLRAQKELREADLAAQKEQHDFERARQEADLAAQKEQHDFERAQQEADLAPQKEQHDFERAQQEADLAAQKEQREHELFLAKERFAKDDDDTTSDSRHSKFPSSFRPKLPKLTKLRDDLDAYLYRFEKHAEVCEWKRELWEMYPASLLTGKALNVYHSLSLSIFFFIICNILHRNKDRKLKVKKN